MRVVLAGEGAISGKHAAAIRRIDDVQLVGLAGGEPVPTERFANEHGIGEWTIGIDEWLGRDDVDAVVLATPTPLHAEQAIRSLRAGKHTLIEIPMAESLADSHAVAAAAEESDRIAMVCHTRRFNPSHQWIHAQLAAGELRLQHLVAETFFFRRDNRNALGEPRSWTDHLLWHHAAHTVDLFMYQTGEEPADVWAAQGPRHPELGIPMDMNVGLVAPSGALCTLALSFNNDGPFGTTFRYICDGGTYLARYDDLTDGHGDPVDVSAVASAADGIEIQDREFFGAVRDGREPNASARQCLPVMEQLDRLAHRLSDPGAQRNS